MGVDQQRDTPIARHVWETRYRAGAAETSVQATWRRTAHALAAAEPSEDEQRATRNAIEELEKELEQTLRSIPRLEKEQRDAVRELDRETAEFAVVQPFEQLKHQFGDLPAVLRHIEAMRTDLLDNLEAFISAGAAAQGGMEPVMRLVGPFDRYEVNVLVTRADHAMGAPSKRRSRRSI